MHHLRDSNLVQDAFKAQKLRLKQQIQRLKDQRRIDKAFQRLTFFVGGIAMPLLTLPQLYTIWVTRETAGVSLFTWLCYTIISLIFFVFGLTNKQTLLVVTYFPMFVIELFIVIGLIIY